MNHHSEVSRAINVNMHVLRAVYGVMTLIPHHPGHMQPCLSHARPGVVPPQRGSVTMKCGEVVGIDLGTTSSAIAVVRGENAEIVPTIDGHSTLPSCVTFTSDGAQMSSPAAENAIASSKRLIGRTYEEATKSSAVRALFSGVTSLPDGSAGLNTVAGVRSPVDVASEILRTLLDQSEAACGVRASRAVIGIPSHFTDRQREATREAAERVGLDKVRLLEEPVAAALAYGIGRVEREELVLVFDLGGGTLDVSVLRVGRGAAEVRS